MKSSIIFCFFHLFKFVCNPFSSKASFVSKICSSGQYPLTYPLLHFFLRRCTPVFDILLRVLSAYMDASRAFLSHHLQSHPIPASNRTTTANANNAEVEREELKNALISAQESAIVQLLLEICLPTDTEKEVGIQELLLLLLLCRLCTRHHLLVFCKSS